MATTTTELDTELSAVNSILGAIGQSPITTLDYTNPEIGFIYNILSEVNKDVQNEGWHFNKEYHIKQSPDPTTKHITIPNTYLRIDATDGHNKNLDVVRREGKLYNLVEHTYEFDDDIDIDVTHLFAFEKIPPIFQRYIIYRSAVRAATQLVSNPELVQLLQVQEAQSRAACMEYECDQGDHSYLGWPHESSYRSYQPYNALRR
tara:strand:+ start:1714 stop:2325 length:612 start_codon:yes stop_codon:yes gene_type:complete